MRVRRFKKSNRGKTHNCTKCRKPIVAGQEFYFWSFRYGGDRFKHVACGAPRPSELTQSLMGDVYASVESVEDILATESWTTDDVTSAVEELVGVVDTTVEAYREAATAFNDQGPNAERADELESYRSQLDDLDLSEWENADDERDCDACEGTGQVDCDACDGDGVVEDPDGGDDVHCDECAGAGKLECETCGGSGKVDPEGEIGEWRSDAESHVADVIGGAP